MTILLTFQTHNGQTKRIADRIARDLIAQGIDVQLTKVGDAPSPEGFEAVVVGAPVRFERHGRQIGSYLRRHRDVLAGAPTALFQVSLTSARTDAKHIAKADQLVQRLLDRTGAHVDVVAKFAGALRYSQYDWLTKRIMQLIAEREGHGTDISRDYEYTDWQAVDRFAAEVAALASANVEAP